MINQLVPLFIGFQVMCKIFAVIFGAITTYNVFKNRQDFRYKHWVAVSGMYTLIVAIMLYWRVRVLANSALFDPAIVKYVTVLNIDTIVYHTIVSLFLLFISLSAYTNIRYHGH